MKITVISIIIFITASIAIISKQRKNLKLYSFFKPLTTILIIIVGIFAYQQNENHYSTYILISLLFSLVGDLFLLKDTYFLHGLLAFLLAHISFIIAFSSLFGFSWSLSSLTVLLFVGGLYFFYLKKDLKNYRVPVGIYLLVIIIMNWQAIALAQKNTDTIYTAIAVAAILFSFSDASIAYAKFKHPFKFDQVLILFTYWIALYTFSIAGIYI